MTSGPRFYRLAPPTLCTTAGPASWLLQHDQGDAAVLGAAGAVHVVGYRRRLAVGNHAHPVQRDAALHGQITAHRFGAGLAQRQVGGRGADAVGVALDLDEHVLVVGFHFGGEVVERKTRKNRIFFGCANYPTCDFTSWKLPLLTRCSACGGLLVVANKNQAQCIDCQEFYALEAVTVEEAAQV